MAGEVDLFGTMLAANRLIDPEFKKSRITIPDLTEFTLALLKSASSEIQSQSMGNRAIRIKHTLEWDLLIKLYGDEAVLRDRIEQLKASSPSGVSDLFELVDKYLSGWRPKNFD